MNRKYIIGIFIGMFSFAACQKSVQLDAPITNPASASVYTSDAKASAVLTSIYARMASKSNFAQGTTGISLYAGLSADELQAFNPSGTSFLNAYTNNLSPSFISMWTELYQQIYVANAALEGLTNSTGVTDAVKKQLLGEAKFMRAFLHFYLVNLWGDVPLVLTTDYRVNAVASRTPKADVWQQIIADLSDAQQLLPDDFVSPVGVVTTERVRPNKAAAQAMLARAYLYTGNWASAESLATLVINNTRFSLPAPANVFLKNSVESIWQISPTFLGINTFDGNVFVRTIAPNGVEPVSLRPAFLTNFETGDQRKAKWVDSITISSVKYYQPAKYRVKGGPTTTPVTEYLTILRLAEVYLIRAEARAQLGNISGAQSDINTVRARASLGPTTANTQAALLAAVAKERQVELFTEWGHRWFDLKRTGTIDAVMNVVCPLKGGTWSTNWQLYPIPATEIDKDHNLTQNPGY